MSKDIRHTTFNLDKALSGYPVMTREGKKVSDIFLIKSNTNPYPVLAVIDNIAYAYSKEGKISVEEYPSCTDLIMAPVTQIINGYVVPRPITEPLSEGEQYFIPNVFYRDWCDSHYWNNDCHDNTWLKRGLIFKTKEEAIAVAKAMLGLDPEKDHDN